MLLPCELQNQIDESEVPPQTACPPSASSADPSCGNSTVSLPENVEDGESTSDLVPDKGLDENHLPASRSRSSKRPSPKSALVVRRVNEEVEEVTLLATGHDSVVNYFLPDMSGSCFMASDQRLFAILQ